MARVLRQPSSHLGRDDERLSVLAGEQRIGFGIGDERLSHRVDVQLAVQPVGDVAQVAVGTREVALFDVGGQERVVARLDGLHEIGEVVAAAGAFLFLFFTFRYFFISS